MARRTSVRRYDTEEVQGEGSFVVLSSMKAKEMRALQEAISATKAEGMSEMEIAVAEAEGTVKLLSRHIVDWDWVDDEDDSLPLPKEDPSVTGELTMEEVGFLVDLLQGDEEDSKN